MSNISAKLQLYCVCILIATSSCDKNSFDVKGRASGTLNGEPWSALCAIYNSTPGICPRYGIQFVVGTPGREDQSISLSLEELRIDAYDISSTFFSRPSQERCMTFVDSLGASFYEKDGDLQIASFRPVPNLQNDVFQITEIAPDTSMISGNFSLTFAVRNGPPRDLPDTFRLENVTFRAFFE